MPFQEATHATWVDHALETAAEPPNTDLDFLSAGELRRTKSMLPSPLAEIHCQMCVKDIRSCGILNDYDFAHLNRRPRPSGIERTGTMPFMWVLLWICCRYDGGKEILIRPWANSPPHDYEQCFGNKLAAITRLEGLAVENSLEH